MIVLGSDSGNYEAELISASTNKWDMSVSHLDSSEVAPMAGFPGILAGFTPPIAGFKSKNPVEIF
jgi:hypothetical protein